MVHPKHLDIEELNQTAHSLTKDSPTEQAAIIREPMHDVNKRWDVLLEGIAHRKVSIQKFSLLTTTFLRLILQHI